MLSARGAAPLLVLLAAVAAALPAEPAAQPQLEQQAVQKRGRKAPDPSFDLFIFVRSYSPTFCTQEHCSIRPITAFTIHGLWPEYATGGWPQFCKDEAAAGGSHLSSSSSSSSSSSDSGDSDGSLTLPSMQQEQQVQEEWDGSDAAGLGRKGKHKRRKKHDDPSGGAPEPPGPEPEPDPESEPTEQQRCEWPSFMGPDTGFWDHEWEKHGTCARPVTGDRPSFFNATMRLHERYDLDVALAGAGILPDNSSVYVTRRLESAIEDAFGVAPLLSCFRGQLLELWLCVDLDLQVRMCPPGVVKAERPTCGKTVKLPVGSPVPADCRPYFPPWRAPSGGGPNSVFIRLTTGAAVAGAAAAAVMLMVRGARLRQRRVLLGAAPAESYDPLQSWLSTPTIKK